MIRRLMKCIREYRTQTILTPLFGKGKPADYIPQLAGVPGDKFGMAVRTVDGGEHLIGHADSGRYRELLGDVLGIGHTNGKQLLKRLRMFQLERVDVDAAMTAILKELDEKDSLTAQRQEEENR